MQKNIPLSFHTTMRVGGSARYFFEVGSREQLPFAVEFAQSKELPILVIGGGSNILVSDEGFAGVVIKMGIEGVEYKNLSETFVEVSAGAGMIWDTLVSDTVALGLRGLENLSSIPGTVGACPVQNIGAYGIQVAEYIDRVEVLNIETMEYETLSSVDCQFGYRDSIFKKDAGKRYIIVGVIFILSKDAPLDITYRDVSAYFETKKITSPTQLQVRDAIVGIRAAKLPDVTELGTAGSFFKNPIISVSSHEKLMEQYPDMPGYPALDGEVKIPAAWIIEHVCQLKGKRFGQVGVYDNQALAVVNYGGASSTQVRKVVEEILSSVKEKTGITLELEVQIVEGE